MKRQRENGSMTVEAALFLVIFLMGFLTIINFARLTRAEVIMQHAINGTSMQISKYGYLLTKTGIAKELTQTAEEAKQIKSDINEVGSTVSNLSDALGGVTTNGVTEESVNNLINAVSDSEGAYQIAKDYFKNPKGLMNGLIALGKNSLEEYAATTLVSKMAKSQVELYLSQMSDDPDAYLEGLGIVGGMEGLNFQDSKCIAGGTKDICIVVKFSVENQMFPWMKFKEKKMALSSSTRIW